jgi:hypothetical protein
MILLIFYELFLSTKKSDAYATLVSFHVFAYT